jgi:hypothetical protein
MYPKLFTFDPVTVSRARMVTLKSPNLDVLLPENRAEMPGIAHFLESGFKARDTEKKLFLPNLSALKSTSIGVFSDYAGESTGRYYSYSFLVCAFGSLDPFKQRMAELRSVSGIGHKEIAFKDFGMGRLRRMLPDYLRLADGYLLGMMFTLVVDKTINDSTMNISGLVAMVSGIAPVGRGLAPSFERRTLRPILSADHLAVVGAGGDPDAPRFLVGFHLVGMAPDNDTVFHWAGSRGSRVTCRPMRSRSARSAIN